LFHTPASRSCWINHKNLNVVITPHTASATFASRR